MDETGAACLRGKFGEALLSNTAIVPMPRVGVDDPPGSGTGQHERKTQVSPPA